MKCTIKEIALEPGMSRNMVAKVLSGKSDVSPKTKTIVNEKHRIRAEIQSAHRYVGYAQYMTKLIMRDSTL